MFKASFSFFQIIQKYIQMTTLYINLSLYIISPWFIILDKNNFVKDFITILHQGDIKSVYSQCHVLSTM